MPEDRLGKQLRSCHDGQKPQCDMTRCDERQKYSGREDGPPRHDETLMAVTRLEVQAWKMQARRLSTEARAEELRAEVASETSKAQLAKEAFVAQTNAETDVLQRLEEAWSELHLLERAAAEVRNSVTEEQQEQHRSSPEILQALRQGELEAQIARVQHFWTKRHSEAVREQLRGLQRHRDEIHVEEHAWLRKEVEFTEQWQACSEHLAYMASDRGSDLATVAQEVEAQQRLRRSLNRENEEQEWVLLKRKSWAFAEAAEAKTSASTPVILGCDCEGMSMPQYLQIFQCQSLPVSEADRSVTMAWCSSCCKSREDHDEDVSDKDPGSPNRTDPYAEEVENHSYEWDSLYFPTTFCCEESDDSESSESGEEADGESLPLESLLGSWACVDTWGLEDFLKGNGVGMMERMIATKAKWPRWEFCRSDDHILFLNHAMVGVLKEEMFLDREYQQTDGRGNVWASRTEWVAESDGACVLRTSRTGKMGAFVEERRIQGETLEFTLKQASGLSWGRSFRREK
eukprot:s2738_g8.t2